MQTKEQREEIGKTWKVPAGFIDCDDNGIALGQYLQQHFDGVVSHANLDAAIAGLGDKIRYNIRVVERAPAQTQATVDAIYREWVGKYAPKDLKQTSENAAILSTYVKTYFAGAYSITSLTEAANNAEGLEHVSAADAREARQQKERDRMERDFKDSFTPQKERNFSAEVKASVAVEKNRKEQASALADARNVIESYVANHPTMAGRQDFGLTDRRRKEMHTILDQHKDKVEGLKAVRAKKMSYPG